MDNFEFESDNKKEQKIYVTELNLPVQLRNHSNQKTLNTILDINLFRVYDSAM